jgi:hypothetical protein
MISISRGLGTEARGLVTEVGTEARGLVTKHLASVPKPLDIDIIALLLYI